eukprot:gene2502-6656_t
MDAGNKRTWRHIAAAAHIVLVDTQHYPESSPFEREFLFHLGESGFAGVVIMDDIFFNREMLVLWAQLVQRYTGRAFDVTLLGHWTGTGLIDFCGGLRVIGTHSLGSEARDATGRSTKELGYAHNGLKDIINTLDGNVRRMVLKSMEQTGSGFFTQFCQTTGA